jgi:hypothetical protein
MSMLRVFGMTVLVAVSLAIAAGTVYGFVLELVALFGVMGWWVVPLHLVVPTLMGVMWLRGDF